MNSSYVGRNKRNWEIKFCDFRKWAFSRLGWLQMIYFKTLLVSTRRLLWCTRWFRCGTKSVMDEKLSKNSKLSMGVLWAEAEARSWAWGGGGGVFWAHAQSSHSLKTCSQYFAQTSALTKISEISIYRGLLSTCSEFYSENLLTGKLWVKCSEDPLPINGDLWNFVQRRTLIKVLRITPPPPNQRTLSILDLTSLKLLVMPKWRLAVYGVYHSRCVIVVSYCPPPPLQSNLILPYVCESNSQYSLFTEKLSLRTWANSKSLY